MKEHKTLNDLNTKIQNLRDSFDVSDEMYRELESVIEYLIGIEDKPYQKIWEELKELHLKTREDLSNQVINGTDVFIYSQMLNLENKHLGVENNE